MIDLQQNLQESIESIEANSVQTIMLRLNICIFQYYGVANKIWGRRGSK